MNKIINKFLIGLLFVLGIILIPTYKVDAAIIVVVKADGVAANKTVLKDSTVIISWEATGATSCSEGKGRGGTGTYGEFTIDSIQATETFTVNCYAPDAPAGYCSGFYPISVMYDGSEGNWEKGTYYGASCGNCSDVGKIGYTIDSYDQVPSWYGVNCAKKSVLGRCTGSGWNWPKRWWVEWAYTTGSCYGFDETVCKLSGTVPGASSDCTKNTFLYMCGCTWHP